MAAKTRGGRPKVGRPPRPIEQVRRNRITATFTDSEAEQLRRLAAEKDVPVGGLLYEIVARALARRRK